MEGREKAPFPSLKRNLLEISGVHGAYLESTDVEPLEIKQPFGFVHDRYEWTTIKDELASWLFTSEPVELTFPDEPGRTYYAIVQNSIDDFERVNRSRLRQGTITFLCLDPYAYGEEQNVNLGNTIANEGTAETPPTFDLTVKKETDLIELLNTSNRTSNDESRGVYLGTMVDVDDEVKEDRTLILHDTMQSTNGWTGIDDVDNGVVTGSFETDENGFYVEEWQGEDDNSMGTWIGPSLKRELDDVPNDSFIVDVKVENHNETNMNGEKVNGVGIVEVYFRDVNGEKIAKLGFGDSNNNSPANIFTFESQGRRKQLKPSKPRGWNNFKGVIRLERNQEYFIPKIAKVDSNGNMGDFKSMGKIPAEPGTSAEHEIKTVQVVMRKLVGADRIFQRIKEVKVWDILGTYEYTDQKKVEKFKEGDTVHINAGTGMIRKNGEERLDLQHFDSELFTLVEGLNRLEYDSDVLDGTVTYRNRYL